MSHDLNACGPLRWTEPNAPLVMSATADPVSAAVGEAVYIFVTLHDDDDTPNADCGYVHFQDPGDGQLAAQTPCAAPCTDETYSGMFGLWPSPPSTGGGDATAVLGPVTLYRPGTFVLRVFGSTEHLPCSVNTDPYNGLGFDYPAPHGSHAFVDVTIEVI